MKHKYFLRLTNTEKYWLILCCSVFLGLAADRYLRFPLLISLHELHSRKSIGNFQMTIVSTFFWSLFIAWRLFYRHETTGSNDVDLVCLSYDNYIYMYIHKFPFICKYIHVYWIIICRHITKLCYQQNLKNYQKIFQNIITGIQFDEK